MQFLFFKKNNRYELFESGFKDFTADGMLFTACNTYTVSPPLFIFRRNNDSSIHSHHLQYHVESYDLAEKKWKSFCRKHGSFNHSDGKIDDSMSKNTFNVATILTITLFCLVAFFIFDDIASFKSSATSIAFIILFCGFAVLYFFSSVRS